MGNTMEGTFSSLERPLGESARVRVLLTSKCRMYLLMTFWFSPEFFRLLNCFI